jgi:CHAD domain-containing protein
MSNSYVERELKFDVEPGFRLPDLSAVVPPGGRLEAATEHLRSDYFDTADHALLRAKMTLRRRTGTTDVGWQLKIPHPPFREEIRVEHAADHVPAELQQLLLGVSRGKNLVQIASVSTERSVTRLVDADGRQLAEIDDDTVHASASGEAEATVSSWREIEIELGEDEVELLYALGKRLRRAGARSSASSSKLARALPAAAHDETSVRKPRAGDVIGSYIAEQHRVILAGDMALRRHDDSVIHPTRVATRRLRSTLRVFTTLLDPARATALDVELSWYATLLGEVRDRQVLQRRLDTMIAQVDDGLLLGPVKNRVDVVLRGEQTEHLNRLRAELSGDRYLHLLADLAAWVRQPPTTPAARQPAASITALVRRADRTVTRTITAANATGDVQLLHRVRKAAKRARYAAEAAEPIVGRRAAAREAKKYQRLQDLLGEHQDSLISAGLLRRLGASAGTTPGENGFAFGVLYEREEHNARAARKKARKLAKLYG